jgi:hypothetical protein
MDLQHTPLEGVWAISQAMNLRCLVQKMSALRMISAGKVLQFHGADVLAVLTLLLVVLAVLVAIGWASLRLRGWQTSCCHCWSLTLRDAPPHKRPSHIHGCRGQQQQQQQQQQTEAGGCSQGISAMGATPGRGLVASGTTHDTAARRRRRAAAAVATWAASAQGTVEREGRGGGGRSGVVRLRSGGVRGSMCHVVLHTARVTHWWDDVVPAVS